MLSIILFLFSIKLDLLILSFPRENFILCEFVFETGLLFFLLLFFVKSIKLLILSFDL